MFLHSFTFIKRLNYIGQGGSMFQTLQVLADLEWPNRCRLLGVQLTELKASLHR